MIKEITTYEVNGRRFDKYDEAVAYDVLCDEINTIMCPLQERNEEVKNGELCITQDVEIVRTAFKKFIELCDRVFEGKYTDKFNVLIEKGRPGATSADYLISNYDYCHIITDTYYRFQCINFDSGREYQQPFYVNHEEDFFNERNLNID